MHQPQELPAMQATLLDATDTPVAKNATLLVPLSQPGGTVHGVVRLQGVSARRNIGQARTPSAKRK